MADRPPCRHCGRNPVGKSPLCRRRELCASCESAGIGRAVRKPRDDEPTEEELDALIAQQLANKPSWWDRCHPEV